MKEFEKNYYVDSDGNIYKKLKPYTTNAGYKSIKINGKHYAIHRLVASMFLDNTDDLKVVNHINGDRTKNNVENLEWCTQQDNIKHYLKYGGTSVKNFRECKLYKDDIFIGNFQSIREASRYCEQFGVSSQSLIKYLNCKGYKIVKDNGIV